MVTRPRAAAVTEEAPFPKKDPVADQVEPAAAVVVDVVAAGAVVLAPFPVPKKDAELLVVVVELTAAV